MERNGIGALDEPAPKQCFGTHPFGIFPDCLLCGDEDSCQQNTVREVGGFICPNCGFIYLEDSTELRVFYPVAIDAEGEVTLGKPMAVPWEMLVMHCIRCGYVLWDEDGEYIGNGEIPYVVRKWWQDHTE